MERTAVAVLQARLQAAGCNPGSVDGVDGPGTYAALFAWMAQGARAGIGRAQDLGRSAAAAFPLRGIDTPRRIAHFLAQAAHETMGFVYLREIWGPTPAQQRYEGRADLGNTQPGDGKRFLGRGIFQLTGRANYARYGAKLGLDLTAHPELAEEPGAAVLTACLYWQDHGLSRLADADDAQGITRRINGGVNGLADRLARLERAKRVLL